MPLTDEEIGLAPGPVQNPAKNLLSDEDIGLTPAPHQGLVGSIGNLINPPGRQTLAQSLSPAGWAQTASSMLEPVSALGRGLYNLLPGPKLAPGQPMISPDNPLLASPLSGMTNLPVVGPYLNAIDQARKKVASGFTDPSMLILGPAGAATGPVGAFGRAAMAAPMVAALPGQVQQGVQAVTSPQTSGPQKVEEALKTLAQAGLTFAVVHPGGEGLPQGGPKPQYPNEIANIEDVTGRPVSPASRQLTAGTRFPVDVTGEAEDLRNVQPVGTQARGVQTPNPLRAGREEVGTVAQALGREAPASPEKVEELRGVGQPPVTVRQTGSSLLAREAFERKEQQRWASPEEEYGPQGQMTPRQETRLENFKKYLATEPDTGKLERLRASVSEVRPTYPYDIEFKRLLNERLGVEEPPEAPPTLPPTGGGQLPPVPPVKESGAAVGDEQPGDVRPPGPLPFPPGEGRGEGLEPQPLNEFSLKARRILRSPETLRFGSKSGEVDAGQLVNRVMNLVPPDEKAVLEDAGIHEAFKPGEKTTAKAVDEWVAKNGPRVEVRRFGARETTPEQREMADISHNVLDRHHISYYTTHNGFVDDLGEDVDISKFTPREQEQLNRYAQLFRQGVTDDLSVGQQSTHWSSISPRSEGDMRGYTEIAVVKPWGSRPSKYDPPLLTPDTQFPSTHSFPPNTLAFARGYMEGDTFHVIEVQSDWAQQVREAKAIGREADLGKFNRPHDDPLLRHYESLALKAAVDHAVEQGAKRIAVSDAETAMMTEGHDRPRHDPERTVRINDGERERSFTGRIGSSRYDEEMFSTIRGEKLPEDPTVELTGMVRVFPGYETENGKAPRLLFEGFRGGQRDFFSVKDPAMLGLDVKQENVVASRPPQEPGMRLHYDRTLPDLLERITGNKGERVELGPHRMAFGQIHDNAGGLVGDSSKPRPDLIFRNPDGTPKTSITARSFDLGKVADARETKPFTLFGKEKPEQLLAKPTGRGDSFQRAATDAPTQARVDQLGLKDGVKAHTVLRNIATQPETFGRQTSALAQFLLDHFEHVLRGVDVDPGVHPTRTAAGLRSPSYDPEGHKVFMDIGGHADPASAAMHEMAHAATTRQYMYPKTGRQIAAAREMDTIHQNLIDALPPEVKKFFEETYRPAVEGYVKGDEASVESLRDMGSKLDAAGLGEGWDHVLYGLTNPREMIAQVFSSWQMREYMDSVPRGRGSMWGALWDRVKDLLGVKRDSALDHALTNMMEVGSEREWGDREAYGLSGIDDFLGVQPMGPSPGSAAERSFKERVRATLNKWANFSAPRTAAASETLGNKLVRYASSRLAGPAMGKAMGSYVLGPEHMNDEAFANRLGRTLVEDRLRALETMHRNAGDEAMARRVTHVMTEGEFNAAMGDPEIQAAIDRHKKTVQVDAERMHTRLGGKLARGGEESGAFVNLKAMLGEPEDEQGEAVRQAVYGGQKGNVLNPLQRPSAFAKRAKGTAVGYDTDYRNIAERMYRGNYEEFTKQALYDEYVRSGAGVIQPTGYPRPDIAGPKGKPIPIRRGGKNENLWLRPDLKEELTQALQTDSETQTGLLGAALDAATDLQVVGPTDAVYHVANMMATIMGTQGSKSFLWDAFRKNVGVREVDGLVRLAKAGYDVMVNSPEVQRELAEITKIGAGRGDSAHTGWLNRWLQGSTYIKALDKAGRLTLDRMYDNLVARGMVRDTEAGRREFINRMGQYNERLMPKIQQLFRDTAVGPFVTAGRTFNRLAMQRLTLSPGFKAASPSAAAKARLIEGIGVLSTMLALPVVWNLAVTGKPFGNPGIPHTGALDLGTKDKDGKERYLDIEQAVLLRRGERISGLQALDRGLEKGEGGKQIGQEMLKDMFQGLIHPWAGPAVRAGKIALTGYDKGGFKKSEDPNDYVANVKAALENLNPTVAAAFEGGKPGGGGVTRGVGAQLGQAVGVKSGTRPTRVEQEEALSGHALSTMDIGQRRSVTRRLPKPPSPDNGEGAAEYSIQREYELARQVKKALPGDVQRWLDSNGLRLTAYQERLREGGVTVDLTKEEKEREQGMVVEEYAKRLQALMSNPRIPRMTQDQKQAHLSEVLTAARARVRAELTRGINRGARQTEGSGVGGTP